MTWLAEAARGPQAELVDLRAHWTLDPEVVFLNHGSYGACPREVLLVQERWRADLEREPVRFMNETLEQELDRARSAVSAFVGARPQDFVFVRNSTSGVNAVLRSLELRTTDEILVTDHGYDACRNAVDYIAERTSARVRVVEIPLPVRQPGDVLDRVVSSVTASTRLALIDHVTSQTGLVFPVEDIVRELRARDVETIVDGAHAPGMLALDVSRIGAAYYAGNFHKWVCAPKGSAMLVVREDRKKGLHPLTISRGYTSQRDRPRFFEEFDWTGTDDPTPWLSVPSAISCIGSLVPGGWDAVRERNREMVVAARRVLEEALGTEPLAPESMLGSLASVALPDENGSSGSALQSALLVRHRIQVPIFSWPAPPKRLLRVSAHLYNDAAEYERLAAALVTELAQENA